MIIVFGSWVLLLILVLLYFFKWSKKESGDD